MGPIFKAPLSLPMTVQHIYKMMQGKGNGYLSPHYPQQHTLTSPGSPLMHSSTGSKVKYPVVLGMGRYESLAPYAMLGLALAKCCHMV